MFFHEKLSRKKNKINQKIVNIIYVKPQKLFLIIHCNLFAFQL